MRTSSFSTRAAFWGWLALLSHRAKFLAIPCRHLASWRSAFLMNVGCASSLASQEPCEELTSQVDVPTFRDGVARQPRSHPLELRLAYPQEVRRLLRVHDLPAAGECPCDLLEDRGLQEGVQAGVLVAPHAFQPSLSGPAVPDFLGDFLEQAAETVGEPLFGASNGPTGAPYSRHVPVRPG